MKNPSHQFPLATETVKTWSKAISKTIQYEFNNEALLLEAITHPSLRSSSRKNYESIKTYERLEFLGDSILNMIVSAILFKLFPNEEEGALAKRKRALICGSTIVEIAKEIKIGDFLLMAKNERSSGGPQNQNNLENAMEALIGAIYLDGGFEKAEIFVHRYWHPLAEAMLHLDPPQDFRSALQEWVQKRGLPLPRYKKTKQTGSKHSPEFTVSLSVGTYGKIDAIASTIKGAEQKAAKMMLEKIQAKI